ncbi:MAG: hypothetical protein LBK71_05595, partial [Verrucomicrobiales bacterium]|nr:hypothetical protein [Verrucomicrobiales bacterium]
MNNNKINTKWAALLAVIGSLAAGPLTAAELFEWQAGTGAWEVGANWDASEPPTPGADVHIFNGGYAEYGWETESYYSSTYGYGNYGFNNVTINNSTLYLDEY